MSTRKQEQSGLGLEGQQAAVMGFAQNEDARVLATYTEAETGKNAARPALAERISPVISVPGSRGK